MPNHADWRSRARALLRHAAAAAGLGVGWLLLSGGAASAAAPSPGDLLGSVVAPAVQAPPVAGTGAVGATDDNPVSRTTAALTSEPAGTVAGLTADAVQPLTDGPLAPLSPALAPAVSGGSNTLDSAVGTLGGTVDTLASAAQTVVDSTTAVLPAPRAEAPDPVPAPAPASVGALDASTTDLLGASGSGPAAESGVRSTGSGAQAPVAVPASATADSAVGLLVSGPVVSGVLMIDGAAPAVLADDRAPSLPALPALPAAVGTAGGTVVGSGGSGPNPAALAAAGFALALAWRVGPRVRLRAAPLPAVPAFDPGSTPD